MTKHALALVSDLLPFLDSRGRSGLVHAACPSLGRAFELRFSQGVRLSPKERREAVSRYAFTKHVCSRNLWKPQRVTGHKNLSVDVGSDARRPKWSTTSGRNVWLRKIPG